MKATLTFNLPEEHEEYTTTMQASVMAIALFDIRNEVFRPHRKHGYGDAELQALLEKNEDCVEVVSKLEDMFSQIMQKYGIDA